jgi:BMFP domain-containing protein YqiC
MKKNDANTILDAVGEVLRLIFRKRDAERAKLEKRVAALEAKLAKLLD